METRLEQKPQWRLAGIIFFGLFAVVLLYAAFMIIWPFITAILVGAILVTLTFPTFQRVRSRLKGSSARAAIVMLLGITIVLVIPALILSVMLVQQANVVVERLQSGEATAMIKRIDLAHNLEWVKRFAPNFDPATLAPEKMLLPAVQQIPGWVARHGGAVLGGIAGLFLGFALVLLSMFFFYVEGEEIVAQLSILSPLPKRYDYEFGERFKDVIDATFRGQLFTSLAQGLMTGIGLAIAQVPGSGFWGAVAALLSLIPMNHPLRATAALPYIRPSLDLLAEIQRTGDIFFPRDWMDAVLSGHRSLEAARLVRVFLAQIPDEYPDRLRRIVLASADDLFRTSGLR